MLFHSVRHNLSVALPALAAVLAISCGGAEGSSVKGGKGANPANGSGGSVNLGNNGQLPGTSNGGVSTISRSAACADGTGVADAIPAVVEMVVDISGSMMWGADGNKMPPRGMNKWSITSAALKDAVTKLPGSIAVGVNFFPNTANNQMGGMCINNTTAVPLALLGGNNSQQRRAFNMAIDSARPAGGTPTHAAFKFGAETVGASMLAGQKFVLLITDGTPTYQLDCSGDGMTGVENQPLIAEVATAAAAGVKTFVIGSPGSEEARADLSQMATKGGTAKAGCSDAGPTYCHLDMTTASDFGAALTAGLAEVAGQIGTCEFMVPSPPAGKTLDPSLVNVLFTHTDGSESSVAQDAKGDCASGWKYDNAAAPTKITLCGTDCDAVKADGGAKIDVIFGCTTETNVPVK